MSDETLGLKLSELLELNLLLLIETSAHLCLAWGANTGLNYRELEMVRLEFLKYSTRLPMFSILSLGIDYALRVLSLDKSSSHSA
jgi:hypothetical protein